jgi:hypothetical protein
VGTSAAGATTGQATTRAVSVIARNIQPVGRFDGVPALTVPSTAVDPQSTNESIRFSMPALARMPPAPSPSPQTAHGSLHSSMRRIVITQTEACSPPLGRFHRVSSPGHASTT